VLASPPTRNAGPNRPVPSSSTLFLALQPQTAGSGNVVQEVGVRNRRYQFQLHRCAFASARSVEPLGARLSAAGREFLYDRTQQRRTAARERTARGCHEQPPALPS